MYKLTDTVFLIYGHAECDREKLLSKEVIRNDKASNILANMKRPGLFPTRSNMWLRLVKPTMPMRYGMTDVGQQYMSKAIRVHVQTDCDSRQARSLLVSNHACTCMEWYQNGPGGNRNCGSSGRADNSINSNSSKSNNSISCEKRLHQKVLDGRLIMTVASCITRV